MLLNEIGPNLDPIILFFLEDLEPNFYTKKFKELHVVINFDR